MSENQVEKQQIIKKAINLLGDNYHSKGRGEKFTGKYKITFQADIIIVDLFIDKHISYKIVFNLWGTNPTKVEKRELIETAQYTML
jgi:hypothetical protein